ncbi:hypothetical protein ABZ510_36545 [Nocardia rhamnosiphila]|uniref:Uncharacterized protein n=1 Tax=Nocardia rhamnosiphila TaxID=426716 RepID=A0ABV2X2F3_9NOCA
MLELFDAVGVGVERDHSVAGPDGQHSGGQTDETAADHRDPHRNSRRLHARHRKQWNASA